MRVLFFTIGEELTASTRARVYQYLPFLREAGFVCRCISYTSAGSYGGIMGLRRRTLLRKAADKFRGWFKTAAVLLLARSYDVVFIQRVLLAPRVVNILKSLNPNIVFDFDDAVFLSDKMAEAEGGGRSVKFRARFDHLLRSSRYVITTQSDFNSDYSRRLAENLIQISTPIDTDRYAPSKKVAGGGVIIGWIGGSQTTKYLFGLEDVFRSICRDYPEVHFELIGARGFSPEGVNITIREWSLEGELDGLRRFDIGIMPLTDDEWSRNKYYKLLQYMALGIPAVVTRVGVIRDILTDGESGYLVEGRHEWRAALEELVGDPVRRRMMGARARETAERRYSHRVLAPRLISVVKDASR